MANEKPHPRAQFAPPIQPTPILPHRLMVEGETKKAYDAFKLYFEMGDGRSIPELVKNGNFSVNSLYTWARRFHWDERCDYAHHEAIQRFTRAAHRANEHIAAQNARFRGEVASKNHKIVTAFQDKTLDVVKAIRPLEQVSKVVSPDGKTTHVVLKPAEGIRLNDAARLAVTATLLARQGDQLLNPEVRLLGKSGSKPHGSPTPNTLGDPEVILFLDPGDGTPGSLATLPPPDDVNPDFNPLDGTSAAPLEATLSASKKAGN